MAGTRSQTGGGGAGAAQSYRQMSGNELVQQAHQAWDQIEGYLSGSPKQDLESVVDELTQRIHYAVSGQEPWVETRYNTLDATALAQHTRSLISRISQQVPSEKRSKFDILTTLADRVEGVGAGSPTTQTFNFGGEQQQRERERQQQMA